MEAPDARRAFPCFDEPNMKATFSITLGRKTTMKTASNMNILSTNDMSVIPAISFEFFFFFRRGSKNVFTFYYMQRWNARIRLGLLRDVGDHVILLGCISGVGIRGRSNHNDSQGTIPSLGKTAIYSPR